MSFNPSATTVNGKATPARTTVDQPASAQGPAKTTVDSSAGPVQTTLDAPEIEPQPYRRHNLPPGLASRYRLMDHLGGGGEAHVYRAVERDTGDEVAIKVFDREPRYAYPLGSPQHERAFKHDHTVDIIERVEEAGVHFEIQEYCRFGTLERLMEDGPLDAATLKQVIAEVSEAIASMRPTVHGDIKPSNILIRTVKPLDLVLTDFGLTTDLGQRSRVTNTGQGTLAYLAPEGRTSLRPSCEWWAFGMTIAQLAAGRHPFQHTDGTWVSDPLIEEHLATKPVPTEQVTDVRVRTLVRGLLIRDYEKRWGYRQVQEWLRGGNPKIVDDTPVVRPTTDLGALEFDGRLYRSTASLGTAIQEGPEARRVAQGQRLKDLVNWCEGAPEYGKVKRIADRASSLGPELTAALIGAVLAPGHRPIYLRIDLGTPGGLAELARNAEACEQVFTAEALRHFGTMLDNEALTQLNNEWTSLARKVSSNLPPKAKNDQSSAGIVRALTLQRAADPTSRGAQNRAERETSRPEFGKVSWFNSLPPASEGFLAAAVRLASVPAALSEAERLELERQREVQAEAEARGRQVADLEERIRNQRLPERDGSWWRRELRGAIGGAMGWSIGLMILVYLFWWGMGHLLLTLLHSWWLGREGYVVDLDAQLDGYLLAMLDHLPSGWQWPPTFDYVWGWLWPTGVITSFFVILVCRLVRAHMSGPEPQRGIWWLGLLTTLSVMSSVPRVLSPDWSAGGSLNIHLQPLMPVLFGAFYLVALAASKENRTRLKRINELETELAQVRAGH